MLEKYKTIIPDVLDDRYYFFIDEGCLKGIEKSISIEDTIYLFQNYYVRSNEYSSSKVFDYLFFNGDYPFNSKDFKFIVLNDVTKHNGIESAIKEIFLGIFNDVVFFNLKSDLLIIYFDDDIEIDELLMSVIDDLGVSIKTFNSCKIDSKNRKSLIVLYEMYKKYFSIDWSHSNICDLILEIVKKNISDLRFIKKIVLKRIIVDSQLEKLILAMFDNNLNVTQTAKDTYMHRNTINNKLEYIKKETDLNIQRFKDAVSMYYLIKS